jgi:methyl-accepting chemotaxis protein
MIDMIKSWTFGRRLATGFGLAALILLLIAVVSYRTTSTLVANENSERHAYDVRAQFATAVSALKDAEISQRGFVLTGDPAYLAPYQSALVNVKDSYARLEQVTAGDSQNQRQRVAAILPLINAKLAFLNQIVALRQTKGFAAALAIVDNNSADERIYDILGLVGAADHEEATRLDQLTAAANASAKWTEDIILWGGLIGALLVAVIGFFITISLSKQISTAVGHVQSSSSELQAAANQQATGSREQSTAMNEITTTISELLATSRQIAESAQRVAQIAEQTASAAHSGRSTVDTTRESISGIRSQVDLIVTHMLELGKKSQEIGAVLEIVSELAEQTNILAINATIEAAGVGEAGKRFAVVADEIRKLADRVGSSAKEIRTLIDDVRGAVNTTVMATETGSKAVDAGTRQFGNVAVAFEQIASLVATTTDASREIELSTKQQSSAVEQVNIAIANVAQTSKETETSSTQTLQTASQLAGLSGELQRIINPA